MRLTGLLKLPRRKYAELGHLRHIPQEYIEKLKRAVPKKVYGNRFGAPPLIRWALPPDDYVPQSKPSYDSQIVNETIQREKLYHRALLNQKFFEKRSHTVKAIPREDWTIFPGDKVQVMVGKDKGRQGTVHTIVHEANCVYVEGLHTKLEYEEILKVHRLKEQPLFVDKNQVQLVDPIDGEPCTAEWILNTDQTEYVRISQRSGLEIPIPKSALRTTEYYTPETYIEVDDKDTPHNIVLKKTYKPKLCSFEQDIMEEQGIEDDREHKPTYWY